MDRIRDSSSDFLGDLTMSECQSITLRAPAKINWTLDILGRRADGYHEVDTLMQAVSLFDVLKFSSMSRNVCGITCDDPAIPTDERNLIYRAWSAMRDAFPSRVKGLRVALTKRIPLGAGLGGGSSDAAATMMAINRLYQLLLGKKSLAELAATLGSDIPFFIYGGIVRARGRGEIITPVRMPIYAQSLVIIYTGFPILTSDAYKRIKAPAFNPSSMAFDLK